MNLKDKDTVLHELFWIPGATELYVSSAIEVLQIMSAGAANRAISATRMNFESSRSHSVFMITLNQRNTVTESKKSSQLLLIDLAGSEKVTFNSLSQTTASNSRMTNHIIFLGSQNRSTRHPTEGSSEYQLVTLRSRECYQCSNYRIVPYTV